MTLTVWIVAVAAGYLAAGLAVARALVMFTRGVGEPDPGGGKVGTTVLIWPVVLAVGWTCSAVQFAHRRIYAPSRPAGPDKPDRIEEV